MDHSSLALREHQPLEFTEAQRRLIRDAYANGASDEEFAVLMEIARARRLNPLLRQIHFVSRWDGEKHRPVWAAQVSIDGLRAIAERTGLYAGQDEPEFVENPDGTLKLCKVRVWRRDWPRPAVGLAYWAEYCQMARDRTTGKSRPTAMWARMPHVMLAKCLPGNVQIETDQGPIRIANIVNRKLKVRVRSVDLATGRETWAPVVRGWRNGGTDTWVRLWVPNGTHGNRCLRMTPDHPVWTARGWVPAGDLTARDRVAVTSPTLSTAQEQVLLGSLLGDGSLNGRKTRATCPYFGETHAIRQADYLRWKAGALASLGAKMTEASVTVRGVHHVTINLRTPALPVLWALREQFYGGGRKRVDRTILDRLHDLAVAVWFMDDGSLKSDRRWPSRPRLALYTCCFDEAQHEEMVAFFERRYGVRPSVHRPGKNPYLAFSAASTALLLERLRGYLVFDRELNDKRWVASDVEGGIPNGIVFVPVLRAERYKSGQREGRYDIEVEGTHTFVYNNVVVSNCSESLALRKAFPEDMSGLYTSEEMGNAPVQSPPPPPPQVVPAAPQPTVVQRVETRVEERVSVPGNSATLGPLRVVARVPPNAWLDYLG